MGTAQIDSGACAEACGKKLVYMRQVRLAQGKDAERIERMWLLADATPLMRAVARPRGLRVARAPGPPCGNSPQREPLLSHLPLDPLGNLMLRFPTDPDAQRM